MRAPTNTDPPPAAEPVCRSTAERHRVEICRGDLCPRCGSGRTRSWGGFAGRRRYRCGACGRTFSTFTGTAVRYLKRLDRWPSFLTSIDQRDSVRSSAERLGVAPSTAFRWRHRLLAEWRRRDGPALAGRVHLARTWLAYSDKGQRPTIRPPRRRGYRYLSHVPRELTVQVALAWERDSATGAWVSEAGITGLAWLEALIVRELGGAREIVTGEYLLRLPHTHAGTSPRVTWSGLDEAGSTRLIRLNRSLRHWLRPLRGVATRYLERYLRWFRWDLTRGGYVDDGPPRLAPRSNNSREHKPRPPPHEVTGGWPLHSALPR
ncbi:MAG TPA: hypothetical protein VMM12_09540 [Longimicrobiales bacterium]|nr:hypothetical protein [Longimicrobiales bacterium]